MCRACCWLRRGHFARAPYPPQVGDTVALAGVLFFDCPEEVLVARIEERGKTSGRTDDNATAMVKRLRTYKVIPFRFTPFPL